MKYLLLAFVFGVVFSQHNPAINIPHGHALKDLVDLAFGRIDHIDHDGQVTQAEFNILIERDDTNNDSCVSYDEYKSHLSSQNPLVSVSQDMYNHFDPDGDDCLDTTEMAVEFHHIDKDGNGIINEHEFEHYYTNLLHHLYGQSHSHGHGK